ncbi:unnamed protein product [Cuscuta campestris]|uniref:Uncharacterized protein n=1 Tax=Cuscuta campestris TaxID=132261 RepID=A0A484N948_9ASTE|nr:unnamed protein product [Cuscuta campestris]
MRLFRNLWDKAKKLLIERFWPTYKKKAEDVFLEVFDEVLDQYLEKEDSHEDEEPEDVKTVIEWNGDFIEDLQETSSTFFL